MNQEIHTKHIQPQKDVCFPIAYFVFLPFFAELQELGGRRATVKELIQEAKGITVSGGMDGGARGCGE